jgi:hypothetical protein
MSRTEKLILLATALLVLAATVLEGITPKEPDWNPSYSRYASTPYACGLTYDRLADLFPAGVRTVRQPLYGTAQERLLLPADSPRVNHVIIDGGIGLDDLDLEYLLRMVAAGDDAFLAAEDFHSGLEDSLGFSTAFHWGVPDTGNLVQDARSLLFAHPDTMRFTIWPLRQVLPATFKRGGLGGSFRNFSPDSVQVLAENQRQEPVLLRLRHGQGHIWICTVPLAFTNYYLLQEDGRRFMAGVFSLLPERPVLWDEYYKAGREGSQSPLRYILEQPALEAAYFTAVGLLLLTVLVHGRRRQRAIPVVEPLRNTSREFAGTIARLYWQRGDHADLARKLTAQFREEVRRRLRLQGTAWDEETLGEMARRTGISREEWAHAARMMDHFTAAEQVSEEQLLTFNKTIQRLRHRL